MITKKFDYTPISRVEDNGKRHYLLPDGSKVPSITTILDKTKSEASKKALAGWRKSVGEKQAIQITTEASTRGTKMHSYLESYILTGEMKPIPTNPFAIPSWYMAAQVILSAFDNINEIWGSEVPVYFSGLCAGTTDCVGLWKGQPAIIDFKQTNKPKIRKNIDDYFIQLAAYAICHNEMHGTDISSGVILMCVKPTVINNEYYTPQYQEFEVGKDEFEFWKKKWIERVAKYYSLL